MLPDFTLQLAQLPADLQTRIRQVLDQAQSCQLDAAVQQQLAYLLISSDYALDALQADITLLPRLLQQGQPERPFRQTDYQDWCAELMQQVTDEPGLLRMLRQFRRLAMLRILWRDALSAQDAQAVWQSAAEISWLAEVCVNAALHWLENHYAAQWGRAYPSGTDAAEVAAGQAQPLSLVVLGMGKLGAMELNLSSDIDLIFTYAAQGETLGGKRSLDHQEYFTRLGQKLIAALDQRTADGYVFRVDMRLRPYGDSGALVLSFAAMQQYYQEQGREWERYAMIKARVIAGDLQAGEGLLQELRPFVYRRYLDFSAIESLRDMKAMINREVRRQGMQDNIKLGQGGIREIEFITQVFQLIRGGRDTELQERAIRKVLPIIADLGLMPANATSELLQHYAFLRNLEHALQGLRDEQTQTLPDDNTSRLRVAWRCGFADWSALLQVLDQVRAAVRRHFDAVIADPDENQATTDTNLAILWSDDLDAKEAAGLLAEQGFHEPAESWRRLHALKHSRNVSNMQAIGRARLDQLMPLLLQAVSETGHPDLALERSLWLVEAVLRRTAYLLLLTENPSALKQLVSICAVSPWLAEQLAHRPLLLDELLTPETLYSPADKERLRDELRQHLLRIPETDVEALMEALRYFRHANVLRVAASDLVAQRPLMKVSDFLTYIAEVVLETVMQRAWQDMLHRYGRPVAADGRPADPGFIIVGYGKLGGIELGYGSDLDLVFIHDGHPALGSDGERSLDSATWYSRMGQKILHYLSTQTASGQLYEVDMRLRPSGNSGLLVSSLAAFAKYQQEQAWTWEHQALVRARVICGDTALAQQFDVLRTRILGRQRDLVRLREDVLNMRQKMRDNLGSKPAVNKDQFHIKQDAGGLVDIEFIVQYCVLAFGHAHPELLVYSDNMRILDALAATSVLPADQVALLQQVYLAYRKATHHAALEKRSSLVDGAAWSESRTRVIAIWNRIFAVENR